MKRLAIVACLAAVSLLIGCEEDPGLPDIQEMGATAVRPIPSGGVQGFVAEAPLRPDDRYISGAILRFTPEAGGLRLRTVSDAAGRYRAPLAPGRYYVQATHPDYEPYSTCEGFFVVGEDWNVGNLLLWPRGCGCADDGTIGHRDLYDLTGQADAPPSVAIAVEPVVATVGQTVTVTLTATDDVGLSCFWWGNLLGCAHEMPPIPPAPADGARTATRTWQFTARTLGRHILWANARDVSYGTVGEAHQASEGRGMGCAELTISR